jgi:hypothetical protein
VRSVKFVEAISPAISPFVIGGCSRLIDKAAQLLTAFQRGTCLLECLTDRQISFWARISHREHSGQEDTRGRSVILPDFLGSLTGIHSVEATILRWQAPRRRAGGHIDAARALRLSLITTILQVAAISRAEVAVADNLGAAHARTSGVSSKAQEK